MPPRSIRSGKTRTSVKHRPKHKFTKPESKRKTLPRSIIRSSPGSAPNVHVFKRSYDHPFSIGVTDADNGVHVTSDGKYMIVKLHTKFNKLPDFDEFKALFSQYKITSIKHRLVPYYSQNQPAVQYSSAEQSVAIPNYEVFTVPTRTSAEDHDFEGMTAAQLDSYLNQTQRKSIRLMPSKTQTYWTKNPKVVGYSGPLDKGAGNSMMTMTAPSYYQTDPSITGMLDQTNVAHYGVTLIIRRVDGLAIPSANAGNANLMFMGFRMENEVFFKTRKVQ